jgi:holliday junction DNA helicase RuvA
LIAFVSGRVAATGPDGAVVEVGGVGLSVQCTPATLATLRVGDRAHVPTSLVVREDSLTLYGFADDDERTVFELLQTASGVGPRLALAMLAVHSPDALRRAVATEDLAALTTVPGIGKKGAQRIVLELKDRLGGPVGSAPEVTAATSPTAAPWRDQVQAGLVNLGWSGRDAEKAVDAVAAELAADAAAAGTDGQEIPPIAVLLKSALKKLSTA